MPTPNARGHQIPTGTEQPSRAGIFAAFLTINDMIMSATATARNAAASAIGVSNSRPMLTWRADAATGRQLEISKNGTTWDPVLYGGTTSAAITGANGFDTGGFSGFSGLVATKDATGRVQLHGELSGSNATTGKTIATVPVGYRPASAESFWVSVRTAGIDGYWVYVTSAGAVVCGSNSTGGINGIGLSNITYYADV